MPRRLLVPVIGAAVFAAAGCRSRAAASPGPASLVLEDIAVVDVERGVALPHRTVEIAGGRIISVVPATARPHEGALLRDGRGRYVIPGLWDMHAHLDEAALGRLLAHGITGVRDMGGDATELRRWRDRIADGTLLGPRLVFAGPVLAGPPATPSASRWVVATPEEATRAVDSLAALAVDFVKVWDGVPREAFLALARRARERGLPLAGHVPTSVTPREASDAGQRSVEHLEFVPKACMGLFGDRPAALPAGCDAAALDSLVRHLARNGTWLDPTISMFRAYVPAPAYAAIGAGFRGLVPTLRASGVGLLAGTDTDDGHIAAGASLHDELALLVAAGFTPAEVLRAATVSPARFLGLADSLGTVAPGRAADLVVLEGDPLRDIANTRRVAYVVRAGRLLSRAQLDSLRTGRR